jgi:hypothetical protein
MSELSSPGRVILLANSGALHKMPSLRPVLAWIVPAGISRKDRCLLSRVFALSRMSFPLEKLDGGRRSIE